jgi:hypothetical protein
MCRTISPTAMAPRTSYKQTLMDRLGPDAADVMKAAAYGSAAAAVSFILFFVIANQILHLRFAQALLFAAAGALAAGALVAIVPIAMANAGEKVWHEVMASGSSTPYTEQYSYQQALVMKGKLDEALSTYEAIIAEPESTVDVRIRAAELYAREAKNAQRAAELFREVIRHPSCTAGEEVYSTNRLVDLLHGPLAQPGRALVELRRLADRYPNSPVGERALTALRTLKALAVEQESI